MAQINYLYALQVMDGAAPRLGSASLGLANLIKNVNIIT